MMAYFPLSDLLSGAKRLFVGMQARKPNGSYVEVQADNAGALKTKATGIILKDTFSGSSTTTKTFSGARNSIEIANDGTANLTYSVNGITSEVKAGEIDFATFEPFTSVTITTTSAYRARVFE